jgi:AMMECR1 domain-containing protein
MQLPRLGLLLSLLSLPAAAQSEQALLDLAHTAVRAEVLGRSSPTPAGRSPAVPVFVTLERDGKVLGCRGSLSTRTSSLEEEVALAARSAAAHDPRYRPLTPADLDPLQVTVTLVRRQEPLTRDEIGSLTPGEGLVLRQGSRTGIVLPWEGRDPAVRLRWAYRKAGVVESSAAQLYRLTAERFKG